MYYAGKLSASYLAFSFLQIGFNGSHILWSKVRRILVRVTKYLHGYNSFSVSDGMLLTCHVRISREFRLYSCLNVKELLVRNNRNIWRLSESNGIRIHNQLVRKRTLNYLAKLAKWFSWVVSFYLHGAFNCMLSSCHIHLYSESALYICLKKTR